MNLTRLRIRFRGESLGKSWVASRRFVQALQKQVRLKQGPMVDAQGAVYVDVDVTGDLDIVRTALVEALRSRIVKIKVERRVPSPSPPACLDCGNISTLPSTVCPACSFREIEACPSCGTEVPRTLYLDGISSRSVRCPHCSAHLKLEYADPISDAEGYYVQPLIHVRLL